MATRKNGKGDKDDFDQGGADGPARLERQGKRGIGDNKRFEGKVIAEMLDTIAAAKQRMKKKMEAAKKSCEKDRLEIKDAKGALVDSGYPSRELNLMIKLHELELQKENIDSELDDEGKETLQQMREALGDEAGLADLPLGQSAIARAGLKPAEATS